jgi:GNAT superfamily N-acetyltransferase
LQEALADWEESFDDKTYATFVAEYDSKVIGAAIDLSLEKSSAHSGLSRPDNSGFLRFAAVLPESRGHGAGRPLGDTVLQWSADTGYHSVVTDWAGHEPAVLTDLAEARLRADLPPSAPADQPLGAASDGQIRPCGSGRPHRQ